jgi:DNA-binding MarR family transcriptional regulator
LAHLERNEGISQVKLAELADTDPMTLVRILDRMEGDGWVERRAHPSDRRARQLFLKKASVPVREEMWRVADHARAEALTGLSATDREQLLSLLAKIHGNLNSRLAAVASDSSGDDARPTTKQRAPKAAAMNTGAKPGRLSRKETKVSR